MIRGVWLAGVRRKGKESEVWSVSRGKIGSLEARNRFQAQVLAQCSGPLGAGTQCFAHGQRKTPLLQRLYSMGESPTGLLREQKNEKAGKCFWPHLSSPTPQKTLLSLAVGAPVAEHSLFSPQTTSCG